jgi:AhpD family alkylhydroperoxidase
MGGKYILSPAFSCSFFPSIRLGFGDPNQKEIAMPRLKRLEKSQGNPRSQEIMGDLESKKMLLNIFRSLANSPAALEGFLKFSGALKEGKLDGKTREAIALITAQTNCTEYCLAAHTVLGKNAGLDDKAIKEARLGCSADRKTAGAITLARQVLATKGNVSDADISAARSAGLDDGDIAEVVANVALNVFTNYFNNLNQAEVDFPKVPVEIG